MGLFTAKILLKNNIPFKIYANLEMKDTIDSG